MVILFNISDQKHVVGSCAVKLREKGYNFSPVEISALGNMPSKNVFGETKF